MWSPPVNVPPLIEGFVRDHGGLLKLTGPYDLGGAYWGESHGNSYDVLLPRCEYGTAPIL